MQSGKEEVKLCLQTTWSSTQKTLKTPSKILVSQSCLTLHNLMDVAHQALMSVKFSRQEYWCGLPFYSPGDCPSPEIHPRPPASQADSFLVWDSREAPVLPEIHKNLQLSTSTSLQSPACSPYLLCTHSFQFLIQYEPILQSCGHQGRREHSEAWLSALAAHWNHLGSPRRLQYWLIGWGRGLGPRL